jgi:cell wall-associated NlpC family hydrolase
VSRKLKRILCHLIYIILHYINYFLEVLLLKKRILNAALTCTVLGSSLLGATPVLADDYDTQIEQAEQKAVENDQAADGLDAIINQLSNEVTSTQEALNGLNSEIERNEAALDTALNDLETANQEMETLLEEIAVLEKNIENRSAKLEDQARTVQVSGNPANYFEFILDSDSLTDVIGRIDIVTNLVRSSNSMIEDQIKDQEAVQEKTEETERKIVQQNALAGELEKTSEELEVQKVSQTALVAQLELDKNSAESDREALLAQRNSALEQVEVLNGEREAVRIAAEEAEAERAEQEAAAEAEAEAAEQEVEEPEETQVAQAETESPEETQQPQETQENTVETASVSPASSSRERNETPATRETSSNQGNNGGSNNGSNNSSNSGSNSGNSNNTSTPAPKPKEEPKPDPKPQAPVSSGNVFSIGEQYMGTPYSWGGTSPGGFDCSGFTQYVFAKAGKSLPRNSAAQYAGATKVSNPQAGDLVFFGRGSVTHVGIYAGGGRFLGAQTSTGVAYTTVDEFSTYGAPLIGYGRY